MTRKPKLTVIMIIIGKSSVSSKVGVRCGRESELCTSVPSVLMPKAERPAFVFQGRLTE